MFVPNLSVKAEYLYYDLSRVNRVVGGLTVLDPTPVFADFPAASTRFNGHIVRVGLNYHFSWGGLSPIVAKY